LNGKQQFKGYPEDLQHEIIAIYVIWNEYKHRGINVDKIKDKLLKEAKAKYGYEN